MTLGRKIVDREPRRRPVLRILLILIVVICTGAVIAVAGAGLWMKHAMRASLPQLDGQTRLRGLSAAVTIRRDKHGVPHIDAANLDDLFMAQGYITAQDRLWQMDMARRMSAGEAAEILGSKLVEHDRVQRVLGIRANAERLTATLSSWDRRYFEDYARGVNAYIADSEGHLPAEFRLLHYEPKAWRPVDSMLVVMAMVQMLDQRWDTKIERETITAKLGPTLADTLYPTGSWRDHPPTQSVPDLTAPQQMIPDVPLDESQTKLEDLQHLHDLLHGGRDACDRCTAGSNEWVISGAHTASGKPLLSNDMHLGHQIPNIWYESDLASGGFHVAGVTVPGIPYIIAGHNNHIAWGFTALYGDVQDLFVEQLNGQDEYKAADGWHAVEHSQETIHVRGGKDVVIEVGRTGHGPIVTSLLRGEKRTISLAWSANDARSTGIPLFNLDGASNWEQFRNALSHWWGPTQNVVYSDDQGHIGYQAVGNIPNRVYGLAPVPITDANHEWQGFVPFEQLPSTLDPASGVIATANARITPDGYPVPLSGQWADPYRNERIWKWLAGKEKLTPADMLTLQTDVYSTVDQELAQRFAYAIDHAKHPGLQLRQAADLLRSWDGVVGVDSPAATIVDAAKEAFWQMVLKPKLGDDWQLYHWAESEFAREQIIINAPTQWLPAGEPTWDDFLADMVKQGLSNEHAPLDLNHWRYGTEHPVEVAHPIYGLLPWFKHWTGTGVLPQAGDKTTVKQSGRSFGPSQRFTMDWSNVDGSTENIVMGESGDPLSDYYRDQWPYWYAGKTFALPFTNDAVAAQTTHTLRLIP
ncbi:penicillin acylase family protein [Silvibacterium acidisoli]|uniref:penicillin acylase family protein n=1 Tax=Acidobacteriaceae bacterium ZG23-2 TaxID=2883246 RepID=UPI00406C32B2